MFLTLKVTTFNTYYYEYTSSKEGLNVHHNSYAHHGQEHKHLEDLVVLCNNCHKKFHNIQ